MKDLQKLEDELVSKLAFEKEKELLSKVEIELIENEECRKLIDIFKLAEEDYNIYLKSFGSKHEFTLKSQKKLYEAKLNLDNNPIVKKYNEILMEINEPRRYLELNLISLFSRRGKHSC